MADLTRPREHWGTRIGVILAVTGSAVGLGNFLRFPGQAAQYGGGAFLVPYLVAFLVVGLPLAWAEWSLGRYGGSKGYNSAPGMFRAITGSKAMSYVGMLGTLMPVMIYMYYVFVEAWCLAYAWDILVGNLSEVGKDAAQTQAHFAASVGAGANGAVFTSAGRMLVFLGICFVLNFVLIYRGVTRGIERFCNIAMPLLIVCAVIVLVRVLTLSPPEGKPTQTVANGLGYMWNPEQQADRLAPGDSAIESLLIRSTADGLATFPQPDAEVNQLKIRDLRAFGWALGASDWTRGESGSPERPIIGEWSKDGVTLHVKEDVAVVTVNWSPDGSGERPDALTALLDKMPRAVAEIEGDRDRFDRLIVRDTVQFREALVQTGWESADKAAIFSHGGSRLSIHLSENEAVIRAPTFLQTLLDPEVWLAATGQIFFSLSVGFGLILTYASYLRRNDDVALSSLTSAAGNGFCEVVLGGMIAIPAAFVLLGVSGVANPPGTFGMGFVTLPQVFSQMFMGQAIGFLFFFLLFLAAVTSSLSMLQPPIALFEEGLGLGRKASVSILGLITLFGCLFIVYFSKGFTALDTVDFWMANFFIFILATVQAIVFGWVIGARRGMKELRRGAEIRLPRFLGFVIKFISPLFLLVVFGMWCTTTLPGRLKAIFDYNESGEPPVVAMSIGLILLVVIFFTLIVTVANARWDRAEGSK